MNYIAKYKCEYCGETFDGGITGNERLAFKSIVMRCVDKRTVDTFPFKEPHISQDHYGIGYLIGAEIVKGEDDEDSQL